MEGDYSKKNLKLNFFKIFTKKFIFFDLNLKIIFLKNIIFFEVYTFLFLNRKV